MKILDLRRIIADVPDDFDANLLDTFRLESHQIERIYRNDDEHYILLASRPTAPLPGETIIQERAPNE